MLGKAAILLASALLGATGVGAFDIVAGDRAAATIVIPENVSLVEDFAADELQYHVAKATGAELPIRKESDADAGATGLIFMGKTRRAALAGISAAELPANAFHIRLWDGNLFFVGRDSRGRVIGAGGSGNSIHVNKTEMGTLFAVYEFLEAHLGVRWLWPGSEGEFVPAHAEVTVAAWDQTHVPQIIHTRVRDYYNTHLDLWESPEAARKFYREQSIWWRRHRHAQGFDVDYGHGFEDYWERYGETHPEYFALAPDGTREPKTEPRLIQLNVAEPMLWQRIVDNWGGGTFINLWGNDKSARDPSCTDAICKAWDVPGSNSLTDRYARFWLAVQELAREIRPDVRIITGAYYPTRLPPIETVLNKEILVGIVTGLEDRPVFYFPWTAERVDAIIDSWDHWQTTGAETYLRPNFFHFGHNSPVNYARHFGRYFAHVYSTGLTITDFDQISAAYGTQGLGLYVQSRMHHRGDWPVETVVDEYFGGFGPAADAVRAYFDHWEEVTNSPETIAAYYEQQTSPEVRPPMRDNPELRTYRWTELFIPDAAVERGNELLAAARSAASGDHDAEAKVRFLQMGLDNYDLTRAASRAFRAHQKGGPVDEFRAALLQLDRHRDEIAVHNVANMGSLRWHEFLYAGVRSGIDRRALLATWEQAPPDTIAGDGRLRLAATIYLHKFDDGAEVPRIVADLRELGGSAAVPLDALGGGLYRLDTDFTATEESGLKELRILLSQETASGRVEQKLVRDILLLPRRDRLILDDGLQTGWKLNATAANVDSESAANRFSGDAATAIEPSGDWKLTLLSNRPVDVRGFRSLHVAFHPGGVVGGDFHIRLNGRRIPESGGFVSDRAIDLGKREWQAIEIPVGDASTLLLFSFAGDLDGRFFLDDVRLVMQAAPVVDTAVIEDQVIERPADLELHPNHPNPFNASTAIGFSLPSASAVRLAIYNLAGQRVALLINGSRSAGSYTLHWDGRDEAAAELATGIYFLRLHAGSRAESRKLVLVR